MKPPVITLPLPPEKIPVDELLRRLEAAMFAKTEAESRRERKALAEALARQVQRSN